MSNPMTLQEIAEFFGISRERVRQIEQSALGKLKRALSKHGVYSYTDLSVNEVFQFAADHEIHGDKYR